MKKCYFLLVTALVIGYTAFAGGGDYAVANISASLLKNANAVLRAEEQNVKIVATDNIVYTYHYVVTILNEKADKEADFYLQYSKDKKIDFVLGYLYDADGKELKKIKLKDMDDLSGVSDNSLYEDNRIKHHNFHHKVYPYTIEYRYTVQYGSSLFFPMWTPQVSASFSVEKSSVQIECNRDYKFRFKAFNYEGEPKIAYDNDHQITTWSVSNLPALKYELFSPPLHELTTMVIFGPTDFQMENYKGDMDSWQDFGKFVYSLKVGRDVLPANIKQKVHQLTDGIKDAKAKVDTLYHFLQRTTRYISIQLGIGGWQPFDAKYVAEKAYGDCKALTNYMYSLLKEAGIRSYYTLVRAGANENYITDDFPSQQFNHVILLVPLAKDSIWLECTNALLPPGYLGNFTGNRYALMIDDQGGKLIRTPEYGMNENAHYSNINASLDEEGNLKLKSETRYIGLQQDYYREMINILPLDKQKRILQRSFDFATYEVDDFKYTVHNGMIPVIHESVDITARNYATLSGQRLFIVPNLITHSNIKLSVDDNRQNDIVIKESSREIDTIHINIPEGYEQEYVPSVVQLTSPFGNYQLKMSVKGDTITCYRLLEENSGRFPSAAYPQMVEFYQEIYKADRKKIVFVKKKSGTMDF